MYHPLMRHIPTFSCCFFQLDLKLNSDKGGDVTTYVTNGEWDLIGNIHVPSVNIKMLSSMSSESFACMCMSSTYHP